MSNSRATLNVPLNAKRTLLNFGVLLVYRVFQKAYSLTSSAGSVSLSTITTVFLPIRIAFNFSS